MTKRRWTRPDSRGKPPKPYRSWLEHDLHTGPLKRLDFEPAEIRLDYITPAFYIPDFVNHKKMLIIESKGRFEDTREAAKYVHIRKCNPLWTLVFVFSRPTLAMPGAKRRANGTKYTHAEWATKNGFDWSCPKTIKKEWL
jgi:hypothetical protein